MGQDTNKTHGINKTRDKTPIKHMALANTGRDINITHSNKTQDGTPIKHMAAKNHGTGHQ